MRSAPSGTLARLALGHGSHVLGDYLTAGGETGGALREAASQLGKRLAAGRVLLRGADGRLALLAFTASLAKLPIQSPSRPMPCSTRSANARTVDGPDLQLIGDAGYANGARAR